MGSVGGFSVLDLETTGFGSKSGDRIVEIGVVSLNDQLVQTGRWSTLLNPDRSVGPSGIHGIKQEWVASAPRFGEIAEDLANRIKGTTLVMHNASFDLAFLQMEFELSGLGHLLDLGKPICTMRLSKSQLPNLSRANLTSVVFELGIDVEPRHSAETDALAASEVFQKLMKMSDASQFHLRGSSKVIFSGQFSTDAVRCVTRPKSQQTIENFTTQLVKRLPLRTGLSIGVLEYLEVLDGFLLDDQLTQGEMHKLVALAAEWGLGVEEIENAHKEYFEVLAEEFWRDGKLSKRERNSCGSSQYFGSRRSPGPKGIARSKAARLSTFRACSGGFYCPYRRYDSS